MIKSSQNINIFIAYAADDLPILEELKEHLSVLERLGMVDKIWYDGLVEPGSDWEESILTALNNSDIILVLVSADFIASDFNYNKEMSLAIKLHQEGSVHTLPVIVRPCLWDRTPFSSFQVLPKSKLPVSSNRWKHVDEPYVEIVEAVERLIFSLKKNSDLNENQKQQSALNQSIEEAEHFFAAGKWQEAKARYQQGLIIGELQSSKDLPLFKRRIDQCKREIFFRRNLERAEEAYAKRRHSDANIALAQALIFKPEDEEAKRLKSAIDLALIAKGGERKQIRIRPRTVPSAPTPPPKSWQLRVFGVEVFKLVIALGLIVLISIPVLNFLSTERPGLVAKVEPGGVVYLDQDGKVVLKTTFPNGKNFSQGLAPVQNEEGQWGFIDEKNNLKIEFAFNKAWPHTKEGLAYVQKEGQCGFINKQGAEEIPFIYVDAASFSEGLAMVKKGEKDFAFLDKNGKEIISDLEGVITKKFKNGEAIVVRNGIRMTIDKKGKCLEECPPEEMQELTDRQLEKQMEKWKAQSEQLIEGGEYQRALMKLNELKNRSKEETEKNNFENQIDQLNRKITDQKTAEYKKLIEQAQPLFQKGDFAAAIKIYQKAMQSDLIFKPEAKENLALSKKFLELEKNQSGELYGFRHPNGLWGIKNADREVVLAPRFNAVGELSNGFIAIQEEGLWGFLDGEGKMAIKPFYDRVEPFSNEGFARVIKNGRAFNINRYGRKTEVLEGQ